MIRVQNLSKSFFDRAAVRSLTFTAPDGAITGLLGANGAGKTTTLRMICGVLQPESGSVILDDDATDDPLARQSRLGALLDHIGIYPRLTVRENLAYFGMLREMPPALLAERVSQVVAALGLQAIADRRTAGFSQGERMKTALGRAILHAPRNLLLDEPCLVEYATDEGMRRPRDPGPRRTGIGAGYGDPLVTYRKSAVGQRLRRSRPSPGARCRPEDDRPPAPKRRGPRWRRG